MFARHVAVKLRPDTLAEFIRVMDNEVLPWLRKQEGFLDTITLAVPGGKEIVSISFWDQEKSAEVYNSTSYPQALEILKKILAGTPQVRTFDVVSSTLQKIGSANSALPTVGHADTRGTRRRPQIAPIVCELWRRRKRRVPHTSRTLRCVGFWHS